MKNGSVYEFRTFDPEADGYVTKTLDSDTFRRAFKDLSGADLGELLADWVNGQGSRPDAIACAEAIARDHRTLQESAIRFLGHVLVAYADVHQGYDDRNEDAVQFCLALKASLNHGELEHVRYLRYI